MNLTTRMNTSRVQEALHSLSDHVVFARNIANAVKPISMVKINLEPGEENASPSITSVKVNEKKCLVTGKNLSEVNKFRLVPVKDSSGNNKMETDRIFNRAENSLEAELLNLPPKGSYLAWVIDDKNHYDAHHIEIEEKEIPLLSNIQKDCSIAACVPSEVILRKQKHHSIVPSKIYIEVIAQSAAFPEDVAFSVVAEGATITCGCDIREVIKTSDPKVCVVPITIKQLGNNVGRQSTTMARCSEKIKIIATARNQSIQGSFCLTVVILNP